MRAAQRVAQLEAKHSVLGKMTVRHNVLAGFSERAHCVVSGKCLLIVDNVVALTNNKYNEGKKSAVGFS